MQVTGAGRVSLSILVVLLAITCIAGCLPPPTGAPTSGSNPPPNSGAPPPSDAATGSAQAVGSPPSFDACALLQQPALAKLVGPTVDGGRAMPIGGWVAGQCAWSTKTAGFELSVGTETSIKAFNEPAVSDAKSKLGAYRAEAVAAGRKPKDISGIGDGAVATPNGMATYQGGTYLELRNLGLNDDQMAAVMRLAVEGL